MLMFFREGGLTMYPIALLGLVGIALGGMAVGTRSKGLGIGAIALASVVMFLAVGGMMLGRMQTDAAIANVAPDMAEEIRVQGHLEAGRNIQLGAPLALLIGVLGAAGLGLGKQQ